MPLLQHRDIIAGIFRQLAPLSSKLPNEFELTLVCNSCFSDGNFHEPPNHQCNGAIILCRDFNSKWIKVRPNTRLYCQPCGDMASKGNCSVGDGCPYAHSRMEESLWKENIDLAKFQQLVQNHLNLISTSQFGSSQNLANPGPSNPRDFKPRRTPNRRGKPFNPQASKPRNPNPMPPANLPPKPNQFTPPLFEGGEITKLMRQNLCDNIRLQYLREPLRDKYIVDIACEQCFDMGPRMDESQVHVCGANWLIAKSKEPNAQWCLVRPPTNSSHNFKFVLCIDMKRNGRCERRRCNFAHNIIELEFWNLRAHIQELVNVLKTRLRADSILRVASSFGDASDDNSDAASDISSALSTVSVSASPAFRSPKQPFPLKGYQFILRCSQCAKSASKTGQMLLVNKQHNCSESLMLIRNNNSSDEKWTVIRPRLCKDLREYILCNMDHANCPKGHTCTFVHGEEEKKLWMFEKQGHIDLLEYWTNERSTSLSVEEHVKKLQLPGSFHVAFLTICQPCYAASNFEKITPLNPKAKEPCRESHEWTPILLVLEEVTYSEDLFVTEPILQRVHKEIYPSSSGQLRCCYVRNIPSDMSGQRLTFCSNSKRCASGLFCPRAHSDRELQLWYFENDMKLKFSNQEQLKMWKYYLPFLSVNKFRKLELALSENPNLSELATPTNSMGTVVNQPLKSAKKGPNRNIQSSVPQSSSAPNLARNAPPVPLFNQLHYLPTQLSQPPPPILQQTQFPPPNYPMSPPIFQIPQPMTFPTSLMQSPQHVPPMSKKAPMSKNGKPGLFYVPQQMRQEKPGPKEKGKTVLSPNLCLFCTCCGITIGTLPSWHQHIHSADHKMKFTISRTAQWMYRAPGTEGNSVELCSSAHYSCTSLSGYCPLPSNESEKLEWQERTQVNNVVKAIVDRPALWEQICQTINRVLSDGQSEVSFTAVPEGIDISESLYEYRKVASQIPYKCEWNFTLTRPDCQARTWQAIFILPGYYPYFYFSSGAHTNVQLVQNTYEDKYGHLKFVVGFASAKPGYYEQWMLLSSDALHILRRFIVHLEATPALTDCDDIPDEVKDDMPNVRKIQGRVQNAIQKWKKVKKFDNKRKYLENDSLYFPLAEPNMVTFVGDLSLFGSPTNTSQLLPHMHQLLNLEEQYQMKLLIHLCERMRQEFRANGVEIGNTVQTGDELICPPEEGALFMRIKLPNGCDMYQEHRDPRIYLLRRAIQMVWIKCIPCNGDSSNEPFEFECPLVSRNSSVLPSDTAMAIPTQIVIVLSRHVVNKLQLALELDKKDYFGVVDIFMHPGYDKRNRSPFESLHMAVAKQPYLSNGRPIVHPESRLVHNLPFKPRFSKEQLDNGEDKLNSNQKSVLEELLTKDYSQAFAVDMAPPPFVLRGCFGSGKTKTLGAFIRLCLRLDSNIRILVCTRSNSAADMYITRELAPYKTSTTNEGVDKRILRLFSKQRLPHQGGVINNYALLESNGVNYVRPQLSHLKDKSYRVIIMTLNALSELLENDDPQGLRRGSTLFDYILVDEAAQILEAEAMIAVTLAKPKTRLVFAGDDMQQRPIIFSPRARRAGLSLTILDRLWYQYEKDGCPVRAHLNVVYRSHPLLVRFLGEAFYSECGKLECNVQALFSNQPPPTVPGVVMCHVYTGGGESLCRSGNSGGHWNIGEAKAVVYRVRNCLRVCNQYSKDGSVSYKEEDVCVISPFHAQINLIRAELRKCRLHGVRVEHLNNVQGREFRVVILSPVLTRKQLSKNDSVLEEILNPNKDWQGMDFCHEPTLLNAAMSRAISILEVVGDAVGLSLCGSEACNNIWAQFVQYAEMYSKASNTCPSQLCTLKWDKNMDNITNPDRWAKDKPEVTSVENYYVSQWEEERQKIISN